MSKKIAVVVSASVLVLIVVITLSVTLKPKNNEDSLRGNGPANKIVGGENVLSPSVYPFFAFLQGDAACAGSLVAPDIVLTAAQCLAVVDVGDGVIINAYTRGESESHIMRTAAETIVHPSFNFPYYDFGIIRLNEPVLNVAPVAININRALPNAGDPLTVIGLGNLAENGGLPDVLQEVTVNAVANEECQQAYTAEINDGIMLCGGVPTGGRDACNGDAGGPLLENGFQVGIVSSGNGCARAGFPGIYARVSWAANWISDTICDISMVEQSFCVQANATASTTNTTFDSLENATILEETVSPDFTASPVPMELTITPEEMENTNPPEDMSVAALGGARN